MGNLEAEANALLKQAQANRDEQYPAHPESYFKRQDRHNRVEQMDDATIAPAPLIDSKMRAIQRHIVITAVREACANDLISRRAMICLWSRLDCIGYADIAVKLKCSVRTLKQDAAEALPIIIGLVRDEDLDIIGSNSKIKKLDLWYVMLDIFGSNVLSMAGYDKPRA